MVDRKLSAKSKKVDPLTFPWHCYSLLCLIRYFHKKTIFVYYWCQDISYPRKRVYILSKKSCLLPLPLLSITFHRVAWSIYLSLITSQSTRRRIGLKFFDYHSSLIVWVRFFLDLTYWNDVPLSSSTIMKRF